MKKKLLLPFLYFFVISNVNAQMTEVEFKDALDSFSSRSDNLTKIFFPNQKIIKIDSSYIQTAEEFPAGAKAEVNDGIISLYVAGWLVQSKFMDYDTLDFVLCHEVGHIIMKGLPNERLADDFAARTCLRLIWGENVDYIKKIANASLRTWNIRSSYYKDLGYLYDPSKCTDGLIRKASRNEEISKEDFYACEKNLIKSQRN